MRTQCAQRGERQRRTPRCKSTEINGVDRQSDQEKENDKTEHDRGAGSLFCRCRWVKSIVGPARERRYDDSILPRLEFMQSLPSKYLGLLASCVAERPGALNAVKRQAEMTRGTAFSCFGRREQLRSVENGKSRR